MSKKEEKRAARQAAARRRLRLNAFCLILAPVMDAWRLGMQGGGVQAGITYPPIEPPKPLRRFIRQQCARVVKWHGLVIEQLSGESAHRSMGARFFSDACAKLQLVERAAEAAAPHASAYALLTMKTYLVCAAIHDLMLIDPACASYPLRMLRQTLSTLADKLLPPESPLILPMNWAYYQTRDVLQEDPLWPEFPPEAYAQEKWLQDHPDAMQTFQP